MAQRAGGLGGGCAARVAGRRRGWAGGGWVTGVARSAASRSGRAATGGWLMGSPNAYSEPRICGGEFELNHRSDDFQCVYSRLVDVYKCVRLWTS